MDCDVITLPYNQEESLESANMVFGLVIGETLVDKK